MGSNPTTAAIGPNDLADLGDEDLEERLCTWAGRLAAATAEFLRLLGEFDAREGWAGVGIRSCAHWLSWRCGMSLATAHDQVRVARRLRPLPVTAAAFGEGRLSYSKVRAICRIATPATESDLVDLAQSATASQVERVARELPTVAPEDVPGSDEPSRAHQPRLHWRTDGESGHVSFSVTLEPADAALVLAVLRDVAEARTVEARTAQERGAQPNDDPEVTGARTAASGSFSTQVLADAFRAAAGGLATINAEADENGAAVCRPTAEVVAHVDADVIAGLRESGGRDSRPGHVEGGLALALSTIEQLACEGGVRLASHGSDGRTLDLGRRCRRPSERQLRVLVQRDRCCTVPGCGRTSFLHAHHAVFWSRGGRTELDNLVLLCGEHHRALHAGAFSIEPTGRQRFRFRDPAGTVIAYAPPLSGRSRDVEDDPRHALIDGHSLTPDWFGDALTRDGVGVIVDTYRRNRAIERTAGDPWACAA